MGSDMHMNPPTQAEQDRWIKEAKENIAKFSSEVPPHGFKGTDTKVVFDTGGARSDSTGKGRYDLVSTRAMFRLALVYEKGANARGDRNWEKGMPRSRLFESALRHTYQALAGETDEDHLAHAAWNLFALMHFEGETDAEVVDIYES